MLIILYKFMSDNIIKFFRINTNYYKKYIQILIEISMISGKLQQMEFINSIYFIRHAESSNNVL